MFMFLCFFINDLLWTKVFIRPANVNLSLAVKNCKADCIDGGSTGNRACTAHAGRGHSPSGDTSGRHIGVDVLKILIWVG